MSTWKFICLLPPFSAPLSWSAALVLWLSYGCSPSEGLSGERALERRAREKTAHAAQASVDTGGSESGDATPVVEPEERPVVAGNPSKKTQAGVPSSAGTGRMTISVADAPIDEACSVFIRVREIVVVTRPNAAGQQAKTRIPLPAVEVVDLLAYQNGNTRVLLASYAVEAGDYAEVRLLLDPANPAYMVLKPMPSSRCLPNPSRMGSASWACSIRRRRVRRRPPACSLRSTVSSR